MASFAFVLNRSPYVGQNLDTLYNLAKEALARDHEVFIFLNYDGVFSPIKNQVSIDEEKLPREKLTELLQKGAEIICNGIDIKIRGIDSSKTYIDGIKTGNLSDLSEAIARVDRLISL